MAVAAAARAALGLDRVLWIPTFRPPHRSAAAAAFPDRLAMVRALLESDPAQCADDVECHLPAPSYTLHTLEALRNRDGAGHVWHLLIGSDNWRDFPHWYQPEAVRTLARIVVYPRGGYPVEAPPPDVTVLDVPELPEASTEFRDRLVRDRETTLRELPAPVARCIRARGLYRETPA